MPETCENSFSLVNNCINSAHKARKIYQVLSYSVDLKVLSKTVPSKCSFILNNGPANIWNDRKAVNQVLRRTCNYFS